MAIIIRRKGIIRDVLNMIIKFLLITEYQDVKEARIKKNFYHLDYCDACNNIDVLVEKQHIAFTKVNPDSNIDDHPALPGEEDEDEEDIKRMRAKIASRDL